VNCKIIALLMISPFLLVGCASTSTNYNKSNSGTQSVDCSVIYTQGVVAGAVGGAIVGLVAGVRAAPIIAASAVLGYLVGDNSCDNLKNAALSKQKLIEMKNSFDEKRERIQIRSNEISREVGRIEYNINYKKIAMNQKIQSLLPEIESEIVALRKVESDLNRLLGVASNKTLIADSRSLLRYVQEELLKREQNMSYLRSKIS
jgi:hypothetical protein